MRIPTLSRRGRLTGLVAIGCLAAAACVAYAVGRWGPPGFALVAGPLLFVLFARAPIIGLVLILATMPLENLLAVGEGLTSTRLIAVFVSAAWVAGKLHRGESFRHLLSSRFTHAVVLFLLFVWLSGYWALAAGPARTGLLQLAQLFGLGLMVADVAVTRPRIDWVIRGIVAGGLAAAFFTIDEYVLGGARRAGGDVAGVNGTAATLLMLLPFAFYLILADRVPGWRLLGLLYVTIAVAAIPLTFSRMSLLLLPFVLLALLWELVRTGQARGWMMGALCLLGVVVTAVLPWDRLGPGLEERAETVLPYVQRTFGEAGSASVEEGVSGRGYHLRVALAIFADHPLIGAGYNNFGHLFRTRYQFEVPGSSHVYTSNRSPHSTYPGMLADLGALGLLLWLLVLLFAGLDLVRAAGAARASKDAYVLLLSRLVGIVFLLNVGPFAFYFPHQKNKLFWSLLGLTVAIRHLSGVAADAARVARAEEATGARTLSPALVRTPQAEGT